MIADAYSIKTTRTIRRHVMLLVCTPRLALNTVYSGFNVWLDLFILKAISIAAAALRSRCRCIQQGPRGRREITEDNF